MDCGGGRGVFSPKTVMGLPDVPLDNVAFPIGPIDVAVSAAAASSISVVNQPEEKTVSPQKPKPTNRRKTKGVAPRRKKSTYNYAAAKKFLLLILLRVMGRSMRLSRLLLSKPHL